MLICFPFLLFRTMPNLSLLLSKNGTIWSCQSELDVATIQVESTILWVEALPSFAGPVCKPTLSEKMTTPTIWKSMWTRMRYVQIITTIHVGFLNPFMNKSAIVLDLQHYGRPTARMPRDSMQPVSALLDVHAIRCSTPLEPETSRRERGKHFFLRYLASINTPCQIL